jgi:serine/threonine protein kinase
VRAHGGADDTTVTEPLPLEEGTLLARKYRLLRTAGFGGMAQLWVAKNEATAAEVCVKVLVPDKSDDESVERFRREAYAAARLSHRAIVRVFDLIELGATGEVVTDGKISALAIVMELLHGETLADLLMKKGKLPLEEALDIALPFLSALAHAHRAGVVHRDLKPDNIFLATDPDGQVIPKVLDFGVSKLEQERSITQDGVMLGTPSFMSPEQARGARNVDARSDVFSAGIVLYMMLSGKNPFESDTFHSVVTAILQETPPPLPGLPEAVQAILDKALAKDPAARYADATELGLALRRAAGRSSFTDAGSASSAHFRAAFDSAVSVPPVGSSSLAPESTPPPAADSSASLDRVPMKRAPTTPIVIGVVGVAVAILLVVVIRAASSGGADVAPAASISSTSAVDKPTPPPRAPVVPTQEAPADTASATAATATTAAPSAPVPSAPAKSEAGVVTASPPSPPPRPRPPVVAPSATAKPPKEIARDPGF